MQTTSLLRAVLLPLTLAVAGLLLPPAVLADGDHHDAEGLVLRQGGVDIVTVWQGAVFGEIEVHHGETTAPIAVFFLDDDGDEFVPDDPDFSLGWVIGDETLIAIDLVGDWVFTVTSLDDHHRHDHDETTLTLMLMHDGHSDFTSPPIPVHIEDDHGHVDAEGLVLRQGGVDIVTVWGGVVTGTIEVPHGETTAPIAVFFLDDDGDEFVPDDPDFSLGWVIGDETLIAIDLVGDWVFTVTGHLEGTTTLTLMLMHDGHADFMSPPIELAVTTTTDAPGVPQQVALLANHPNPFNPATTLRFDLPQTAGVHLAIHDAAGKRVRTLLAGEMRPAGAHAVTWDGRDDAGRTVAAGVYLSRLLVAGESHTRTMVLVK